MIAIHTGCRRHFRQSWIEAGGWIEDIRRTGEERYFHAQCRHPVRANKRRKDVPAKLLSCLNQIVKARVAGSDTPVELPTVTSHN